MASPTIRYSDALLSVTRDQGNSDAVDADLGILRALFRDRSAGGEGDAAQELRLFLEDPRVSQENKIEALRGLLSAGERSPEQTTMNFLELILRKGRQGSLQAIVEDYHKKALGDRGEAEGRLVTALPLDESELADLKSALSKELGKQVLLDVDVDEDLIGGFRALIGDSLFDASLKGQLEQLGRRLKGVPLQ